MKGVFFISLCIILIGSLRGLDKYVSYNTGSNNIYTIPQKSGFIKERERKEAVSVTLSKDTSIDSINYSRQIYVENPFNHAFDLQAERIVFPYEILFIENSTFNYKCKIEW